MSEGEFKKFIKSLESTSLNHLNADALRGRLDEARQEFPCFKCQVRDDPAYCVSWARALSSYLHHGICPHYPYHVFELKWLGDKK